jgi:hypothetical protein
MSSSTPTADSTADTQHLELADRDVSLFRISHPKNIIGMPLAIAADGPLEWLLSEHLIDSIGDIKLGAQGFHLVDRLGTLTPLGKDLCATGRDQYGNEQQALEALGELTISEARSRFVDVQPIWQSIFDDVIRSYEALHAFLSHIATVGPITTKKLTQTLVPASNNLAEHFLLDRDTASKILPTSPTNLERVLNDASIYRTATISHLKSILYHTGHLTERGADTNRFDPQEQIWAVEPEAIDRLNLTISSSTGGI